MQVCAIAHFSEINPKKAALRIEAKFPVPGTYRPFVCTQCAKCEEACPEGAISQNEIGAFIVDKEKCTNCGECIEACPFDAVHMEGGLPRVDPDKCVACGKCVSACPRGIIAVHPRTATAQVLCRSTEKGGVVRKVCSAGCIGCKKCEKACPSDAVHVVDFLAAIDDEKCTRCGKCVAECPTGCLVQFDAVTASTA